jgi:hypothetical protein
MQHAFDNGPGSVARRRASKVVALPPGKDAPAPRFSEHRISGVWSVPVRCRRDARSSMRAALEETFGRPRGRARACSPRTSTN